jgi:hypothetical protein
MSNTFIVYPNESDGICLIVPTGELSIEEVARKDVPAGKPYRFILRDQFSDFEYFEAWEVDFSNPDGYGIGHVAWFAEQEGK